MADGTTAKQHSLQGWWASRTTNDFIPNQKAQLVQKGDAYDLNYGIELKRHIHGNAAEQYIEQK